MKTNSHSGRRRTLFVLVAIILLLGVIFLPGKNGAVSVLLRYLRIRKKTAEQHRLRREIDSLERAVHHYSDPSQASELARRLLGTAPADTGR